MRWGGSVCTMTCYIIWKACKSLKCLPVCLKNIVELSGFAHKQVKHNKICWFLWWQDKYFPYSNISFSLKNILDIVSCADDYKIHKEASPTVIESQLLSSGLALHHDTLMLHSHFFRNPENYSIFVYTVVLNAFTHTVCSSKCILFSIL